MVNKNKKFLAGAIILAMSISAITQTSYASDDEIGANNDVSIDENQGKDKDSHEDLKEDEIGVKDSDANINEDGEYGADEEIDSPISENKLEDIKESLKTDINLSDLSDDLKKDYSDQIDQAQNEKDLEDIETQFFADLFESEDDSSDEEEDVTESSDENNDKSSDDKELEISDLEKDSDQVSSEEGESDLEAKKEGLRNKLVNAMASGKIDPIKLSEYTEKVGSAESDEDLKAIEAEIYQALGEELPEEDSETEQAEDELAEDRQLAKEQIDAVAAEKNMPADFVDEYYARIDAANSMDDLIDITSEANDWENPDSIEPEVDPLQEEKELYHNSIDKLENLDDERKTYYKSEIDKANGTEEFRSILDNAQAENNENAPVEEFDFKGIYKDLIDKLEYLSEDQKQGFKDQIDAVDEEVDGAEEAIHEIWISAQTQNEGQEPIEDQEDLNSLKDVAKSVVDKLENLSEEEKQAFKDQIDGEKSLAGIDGILDKAKDQDDRNEFAKRWLEDLREEYIAKLPTYEYLTDDQRAAYEKQFKEAKDQEAMRLIDYDAQLTNINQEPDEEVSDEEILEDYKALALEEIEAFENLTDEKVKEDFLNQVKAVKMGQGEDAFYNAKGAIDAIVKEAEAWKASDNSLDEAKEAAKAEINALDELTEAEKEQYLDQVDKAEELDAINKAVEDAKAINDARLDLEKAKEAGKTAINALDKLTEAEKQQYLDQVDKAEDLDSINKAVEDAKAINDARLDLEKAKEAGKTAINALDKLTEAEKEQYLDQVDKAEELDAINKAIEEAKAINDARLDLEKAKEAAKTEISALDKLTEAEKQQYINQVDQASDKEAINKAVEDAKALNDAKSDLEDAKKSAKETVANFANLTSDQKEEYLGQIDNADSKEKIDGIVASAKAKDAENLKVAKKDAKSSIDELSQINEDKKQSYKEEIDRPSTDTIAKVNEIVSRAKNDSSEKLPEEDTLKAYKDEYKNMIDSLPTLSYKEKESFKKEIDKASSLDQIKSTYSEALNLVASRRNSDDDFDYLRDYIIDRINELENLRDFEKENFIAKVKDANTFENIFDIYIQAIKSDNNAMIYVPIGYEYIPSGYYYRYDLYNSRLQLLEAYKDNRITVAAAKILLENYPNTVKNVKDKLEKLVKESEELQKQAEAMLIEYDKILILDYKAEI